MFNWLRAAVVAGLFCLAGAFAQSGEAVKLADPKSGGVDGKPVSVLVLNRLSALKDLGLVDPAYKADLEKEGFSVTVQNLNDKLALDYLKQFSVVLLAGLPHDGDEFQVYGYLQVNVPKNLEVIQQYIAAGGGVLLSPGMFEFGEAYGVIYNKFLAPYDASILVQQLRDADSSLKTNYAEGVILPGHEIAKGIEPASILYPINVLRWDNGYSTTPVICGKDWTLLAQGKASSGTHIALDNSRVGDRLTQNRNLFAVRQAGKGYVGVSAICSYYTLLAAYWKEKNIGENDTGVIDGIVLNGEKDGRPSAFGKLVVNTLRCFAANSTKNGIGKDVGVQPNPPEQFPVSSATIDWEKQLPPPTWAHRVIPSGTWPKLYDEQPDPSAAGEIKHWKVLVGPRTRYSSGSGSVADYRKEAIAAGYNAIVFAERFDAMDGRMWKCLVQDCRDNTDADFIALPGFEIEAATGETYLVLCSERWPDKSWLTDDGKQLKAVRMLSLGWFGHIAAGHRPGSSPIAPRFWKHCQAISVATYNTAGKLADDGMYAYQWQLSSDSNPLPLAVHEVMSPEDVKKAVAGLQQIMPAPTLAAAVKYFRYSFSHGFDCPVRYYLSEGPLVTGWSIYNKDLGKHELNRDRYRLGVGFESAEPIKEVKLFDGFKLAKRWLPGTPKFAEIVDGPHDMQHLYFAVATDAKGRRAITPQIRTVPNNWPLRCGDHQNWLGSLWVYTGWDRTIGPLPGFDIGLEGTREGSNYSSGMPDSVPPMLEFRFFSNQVQVMDARFDAKYFNTNVEDIAGDGKGSAPQRPTDVVEANLRYTLIKPQKTKDFDVLLYEVEVRVKQDAVLSERALNPILGKVIKPANNLLILPNAEPKDLYEKNQQGVPMRTKGEAIAVPVGSYVAGVIPLTEGLQFMQDKFGLSMGDNRNLPAGTTYHAKYLVLDGKAFWWNRGRDWDKIAVDDRAVRALTEMGFRGETPYKFTFTQGKLDSLQYYANCTAANGGVAGSCDNPQKTQLLSFVPLAIKGLNPLQPAALWRSDAEGLEYFGVWHDTGYIPFNADASVEFFAGNIVNCDPGLSVSVSEWNKDKAAFRANNTTSHDITCEFSTAAAVKGCKQVKKQITVKAGAAEDIKE